MTLDEQTLERVVGFHGHMCAGLAMGIRAAEAGLAEVGPNSAGQEVVAIVETDMCGVDAVQFLTGCTFGKGNLVHRDHGKNAYTFVRRSDGRAVRVSSRPGTWGGHDPEWLGLFAKMRAGAATAEERQRFAAQQAERSARIMAAPIDELYDIREVDVPAPPPARILTSVTCAWCEEPTMETRIRRLDGKELCPPCFEQSLAGATPVASPPRL